MYWIDGGSDFGCRVDEHLRYDFHRNPDNGALHPNINWNVVGRLQLLGHLKVEKFSNSARRIQFIIGRRILFRGHRRVLFGWTIRLWSRKCAHIALMVGHKNSSIPSTTQ